jgi:acetyltransferase-like isoleucine patch superfamily enzyme
VTESVWSGEIAVVIGQRAAILVPIHLGFGQGNAISDGCKEAQWRVDQVAVVARRVQTRSCLGVVPDNPIAEEVCPIKFDEIDLLEGIGCGCFQITGEPNAHLVRRRLGNSVDHSPSQGTIVIVRHIQLARNGWHRQSARQDGLQTGKARIAGSGQLVSVWPIKQGVVFTLSGLPPGVVRRGARIGPYSVLGSHCHVAEDSAVEGAILWPNTWVDTETRLGPIIAGRHAHFGRNVNISGEAMFGDKSVVTDYSKA